MRVAVSTPFGYIFISEEGVGYKYFLSTSEINETKSKLDAMVFS